MYSDYTPLKCSEAAVVVAEAGTNVVSSPAVTVEPRYQLFWESLVLP